MRRLLDVLGLILLFVPVVLIGAFILLAAYALSLWSCCSCVSCKPQTTADVIHLSEYAKRRNARRQAWEIA